MTNKEIGNIGSGNAITAISRLIKKKINVDLSPCGITSVNPPELILSIYALFDSRAELVSYDYPIYKPCRVFGACGCDRRAHSPATPPEVPHLAQIPEKVEKNAYLWFLRCESSPTK
jgi:hypothetical protein